MIRIFHVSIVLLLLVLIAPAFGQDATLNIKTVTNTRDDLLLFLDVEGAFTQEVEEAILNGVPASFTFFISLDSVRSFWWNINVVDLELLHEIKYDNLKKEFSVTRHWENENPTITKSFDEAKKLMTHIDSLKIAPLNVLEKGKRYQIRAKAELGKITLPFYLHYVLFFVSLWDFETDWYTIDFIY